MSSSRLPNVILIVADRHPDCRATPIARKAVASFACLIDTQNNTRSGSPIVAGSTTRRRSSSNVGSLTVSAGWPHPGRRTLPVKASVLARSFSPRPIVLRAILVARDTAAIPPWPAVFASAATKSRRERSSNPRPNAVNRAPIIDTSIIQRGYANSDRAGIALSEATMLRGIGRFGHTWASP